MRKWKYMITDTTGPEDVVDMMNRHGENGWELVQYEHVSRWYGENCTFSHKCVWKQEAPDAGTAMLHFKTGAWVKPEYRHMLPVGTKIHEIDRPEQTGVIVEGGTRWDHKGFISDMEYSCEVIIVSFP